ncbi:dienelactone hydrolase family protein [Niabella pedocola]|uniref:Dienelactone hydrolase family protein n=1 Tax=Niabella pedocola TaxID=1752077 RepID=A0ABS8PVG6_9BACT|nr:dienelactone hydrolase family protein [Niabella pedocola]MCD2425067.1 dienelactone hydrolase family protein [Niabella pedocola]
MHTLNIITGGKELSKASRALIMLHGRGASAEDILSLAPYLDVTDMALLAPQATNHTWYPYSFMAPVQENEPWLSSAIDMVHQTVKTASDAGIASENMYFLGFSQGACLTLEYIARQAQRYGGAVAFTGGLIGEQLDTGNYKGDFKQTPVFIGTSNPDFHVPVERVHASTELLKQMNADVTEKVYPNMGHTISADEISLANQLVFNR